MKKLFAALLLALTVALAGCPANVQPNNNTEKVYVAQESLVVYATWLVDAHDAGTLSGDRYEAAKALYKGGRASLTDARKASLAGNSDGFLVAMTAVNRALAELALYKGNQK